MNLPWEYARALRAFVDRVFFGDFGSAINVLSAIGAGHHVAAFEGLIDRASRLQVVPRGDA